MASGESSFDIVSEIDRQELANALDQTRREILARYDFKDSHVEIKEDKTELTILAPTEFKFNAVMDIIKTKLIRREVDLRVLGEPKIEAASGGTIRAIVPLVEGISGEEAKLISKLIRDNIKKVKSSIQGDAVRVSSKSRDDLQEVIAFFKDNPEVKIPLQFINYR